MNRMKVGTEALALSLCVGTTGYATAAPSAESSPKEAQMMKGTIQGEVKKVQPDAVIVEVDTEKAAKKEVRLPLNQATHVGP